MFRLTPPRCPSCFTPHLTIIKRQVPAVQTISNVLWPARDLGSIQCLANLRCCTLRCHVCAAFQHSVGDTCCCCPTSAWACVPAHVPCLPLCCRETIRIWLASLLIMGQNSVSQPQPVVLGLVFTLIGLVGCIVRVFRKVIDS